MIDAAELTDNDFLRQFELKTESGELAKIEYSLQDRKIFLTKLFVPDGLSNDNFEVVFLTLVFENIKEREIGVVPASPEIAKFIRRHRKYKKLLPVGIRI
ncbi:MAG: N-acetyltransferase [Bacteroidota bacterium]